MKKFAAVLLAMILVVALAVSVSAAGINESEQKVLDELSSKVEIGNGYYMIPTEYVNQAENYFNTIDMTPQQADEIIGYIQQGEKIMIDNAATSFNMLTYEQKIEIMELGQKAVGVLGMTLTVQPKTNIVTILDPNGNVAFLAEALIIPYTTEEPTSPSDGSASSSGEPGGTTTGGDAIKTTGMSSDATAALAVSAVIILFVAVAGVYLVKTKRARS
ncbi:MAG: hypothetical protein U0M23_01960 [Acutalibacteraceae bacterium]|nr:hypothetical protein [Acutalibacteraceae bacterium]HIR02965.1 hypothetical protein [Candidatus Scatovicinus merdipullorum]